MPCSLLPQRPRIEYAYPLRAIKIVVVVGALLVALMATKSPFFVKFPVFPSCLTEWDGAWYIYIHVPGTLSSTINWQSPFFIPISYEGVQP